jgi:hypothetical protein
MTSEQESAENSWFRPGALLPSPRLFDGFEMRQVVIFLMTRRLAQFKVFTRERKFYRPGLIYTTGSVTVAW